MTPPDAKTIVETLGGPAKVARLLDSDHSRGHISRAAVSQWSVIPEKHCETLANESKGQYTPADLRPDLDWICVNGKYYTRQRDEAA